jgi:hypothetical protein
MLDDASQFGLFGLAGDLVFLGTMEMQCSSADSRVRVFLPLLVCLHANATNVTI